MWGLVILSLRIKTFLGVYGLVNIRIPIEEKIGQLWLREDIILSLK